MQRGELVKDGAHDEFKAYRGLTLRAALTKAESGIVTHQNQLNLTNNVLKTISRDRSR